MKINQFKPILIFDVCDDLFQTESLAEHVLLAAKEANESRRGVRDSDR